MTPPPPVAIAALQLLRGRAAYERAWRQVFELHHPELTQHFRWRLQDDAEADDVVAETWERAIRRIGRWSQTGPLGAWLRAVGEHVVQNRRRALARAGQRDRDWWQAVADFDQDAWAAPDVLERLAVVSERRWLERQLTAGQRSFIVLRVDEGLSHAEIAWQRGLASPECAQVAWQRICARARKLFAERGQPAPAAKRRTTQSRVLTAPQKAPRPSGPTL